ncbi:hypothetical protein ANCDUO_22939 [Ancylostoma duodenale]|uniref:Oxidoreductase, short chain dehydrogenase/reductase family protein n=1 Tax=Ancylostoma duodenale TaxID=51022 RepID=A0A0C2FEL3_9BILA|nr:hypothetical protein ANCDUO_22939 [Ancylostoma duodenale]
MGQFDGRVVIVTGSSNGIGRATAQRFAREGAMLTICGRDEKALNKLSNASKSPNGDTHWQSIINIRLSRKFSDN